MKDKGTKADTNKTTTTDTLLVDKEMPLEEKQVPNIEGKSGAEPTTNGDKKMTTTFDDSMNIEMPVEKLYDVFTDEKKFSDFSKLPATFKLEENGKFSLFDGEVEGTFVSFEPNKKLVQKWRSKAWPLDKYATLTYEFNKGAHGTKLDIHMIDVPSDVHDVSTLFHEKLGKQLPLKNKEEEPVAKKTRAHSTEEKPATAA